MLPLNAVCLEKMYFLANKSMVAYLIQLSLRRFRTEATSAGRRRILGCCRWIHGGCPCTLS